jgi:alkaline phosphatase D
MTSRRDVLAAASALALAGCGTTPSAGDVSAVAPPPQLPVRRIVLASCADQSKPQPIWGTAFADRPDLVLFAGDNVYSSEPPWSADKLARAYAAQAAVPSFAQLRSAVPHMAIWDDHDYGMNDAGAEFPHKAASKQAFLDFWQVGANDPRRQREGIYHAESFGPPGQRVQVIMLDIRWFRSPWKPTDERNAPGRERYVPDDDPAKTMLGPVQWQWLERQLREPADLRLVVSSIQVVADGHGWERWGNFPLERARLYRLIAQTGAGGVVFLSGDRHIGALYAQVRGVPYPLYELTASGVTHPWAQAREAGPNRIGDLFAEQHYGMVDVDWASRTVQLQLRDVRGAVRRNQGIPLSLLRAQA